MRKTSNLLKVSKIKKLAWLKLNMRKAAYFFVLAFVINLIWENAHGFLYLNYKGGEITEFILLRASLADAAILLTSVLILNKFLPKKIFITTFLLTQIIIAVAIEKFALGQGRWVYSQAMPIIPFLKTGLMPTVQLAITGLLVKRVTSIPVNFLKISN